jgi:single-strand DNA-binding protein
VTVFGARGEALAKFLSKGAKVAIEGKLRWSQWENPQGEKRSKLEVIADEVEFMSSRDSGSGTYTPPAASSGGSPDDGEEIPF